MLVTILVTFVLPQANYQVQKEPRFIPAYKKKWFSQSSQQLMVVFPLTASVDISCPQQNKIFPQTN